MPSRFVRAFLSLVLSILLPFRRHSWSLLPTGPASLMSYCAVVIYILYEARLEFALVATASLNYGLRPVVDYILYGAKLEFVLSRSNSNYWRTSKTISTILRSLPPCRLFHLDDSCLASGYHHRTLHALSLCLHSIISYRRRLLLAITISTLLTEGSLTESVQHGKRDGFRNEGVSTWSVFLLLVAVDPHAFNSEKSYPLDSRQRFHS